LVGQLVQDYRKDKFVRLNADNTFSKELDSITSFEIFTYVIDNEADFIAQNINESINCATFTLTTPFGEYEVESPYLGKFNILNLLASLLGVWVQGYDLKEIIKAVKQMPPVEG